MDIALKNIFEQGWQQLADGAVQSAHAFRNCTVAHAEESGTALYTVVVRNVNSEEHQIVFYTDIRSEKIAQLKADPSISILFYDNRQQLQYTVKGTAQIDAQNETALQHWQKAGYKGHTSYLAQLPPSTPVNQPADGLEYLQGRNFDEQDTAGYENFAVLTISTSTFEYLQLSRERGNRRARFELRDAKLQGTWIIP